MTPLGSLVGIPWLAGGRGRQGIDCVGLVLLAQWTLWGRWFPWPHAYNPERDTDQEERIFDWLPTVAIPCNGQTLGGIVVLWLTLGGRRYGHVATFVDVDTILHTYPGGASRLSRFSPGHARRARAYFRSREEGSGCPERP